MACAPCFLGDDGLEEESGCDATEDLGGPIEKCFHSSDALGDPEADADRGIEVAAGNVAKGGNHDGDGQSVGKGDAKKTDAAGALQITIRANGAGAKEDKSEGAEKFGGELLEVGVHGWEILAEERVEE